jgi:hypothetical protein
MLVERLKAMRQGPSWWQTVISAAVAIVNVRFFYFKRPALLALLVASITVVLTVTLAVIIRYQSCTTLRQTVPLPFIEEQMGSDAYCKPLPGYNAWLKSDWVSYSTGYFSKEDTRLYTDNIANLWGAWAPAISIISNPSFLNTVGKRRLLLLL